MHFLFCGSTNLRAISLAPLVLYTSERTLNFFNSQRGYKEGEFVKLHLRFQVRKIENSLVVRCRDKEFEIEDTTRIRLVIV